jgi:hypothetical protein
MVTELRDVGAMASSGGAKYELWFRAMWRDLLPTTVEVVGEGLW